MDRNALKAEAVERSIVDPSSRLGDKALREALRDADHRARQGQATAPVPSAPTPATQSLPATPPVVVPPVPPIPQAPPPQTTTSQAILGARLGEAAQAFRAQAQAFRAAADGMAANAEELETLARKLITES